MSKLLATRPLKAIRDCTGKVFELDRDLMGPERYVAWVDTRAARARIDAGARTALEAVAARHRASAWQAMRDGWQPGEYDRVLSDAVPRYEAVLQRYTDTLQAAVAQWTVAEARRQAASAEASGQPIGPAREAAIAAQVQGQGERIAARVSQEIGVTARAMAARVQSEVARAVAAGAKQATWKTDITAASLAAPALAVGQVVESEGRIAAAARLVSTGQAAQQGLVLSEVVRTSVNDHRRCPICKGLDGTTYELPQQMRQFEAMPLPDPNCLGGTRYCRCGWLMVWRKLDRS